MNKTVLTIGALLILVILYLKRKPIVAAAKTVISNMTRPQFIERFSGTVKQAAKGTGLFPSLFMAQAILESSDSKGVPGNSGLSKNHNNYFGIKASKDWKGKIAVMKTREVLNGKSVMVDAPFRKYDDPTSSFADRVLFLLKNSRYSKAGVFKAKTPFDQAKALQQAGYATDPKYAEILGSIINKYSLTKLDV